MGKAARCPACGLLNLCHLKRGFTQMRGVFRLGNEAARSSSITAASQRFVNKIHSNDKPHPSLSAVCGLSTESRPELLVPRTLRFAPFADCSAIDTWRFLPALDCSATCLSRPAPRTDLTRRSALDAPRLRQIAPPSTLRVRSVAQIALRTLLKAPNRPRIAPRPTLNVPPGTGYRRSLSFPLLCRLQIALRAALDAQMTV
jgi:hypothetical protein